MVRLAVDQTRGIRHDAENANWFVPRSDKGLGNFSIAVTSGKGGVGKTQLSANIASCLAARGKKVLVVDADLGLASLDLAFGVVPEHDLRDYLNGPRKVEEIILNCQPGIDLLPACPGRYQMANLDLRDRTRLINGIRSIAINYDCVVMDTGAGIGSNAVSFASLANEIVLVVTPDPASLRDAYAMAKVLHRRKGIDRIQVISNKVDSELEGIKLYEKIDRIATQFLSLELEYLGSIPRDSVVSWSNVKGEPFVQNAPRSRVAIALQSVVGRLDSNLRGNGEL